MDISNRTVFIAGGTSGIGRGLAQRFTDAGSTVVVGGRRTASDVESVAIDVTDPASVVAARDQVLASHPGLDTVVSISGVMLTENLRNPAHFKRPRLPSPPTCSARFGSSTPSPRTCSHTERARSSR